MSLDDAGASPGFGPRQGRVEVRRLRHWHAVWPRVGQSAPHVTSFVELLAKAGPPGR
ncbi:hypothetical protein LXT21_43135 [Myxococcus sp. K38C18041901]|uniref:hypothetical protein n=1 Tax=Myxococcus guangdongensis TaxID=2906760 RepID=UPI0020A7302C|nr:hypothetical protein [Myxococcus guangdongensis]MCP3065582.1 hypothetical protein [Myxococcus guangdongensis]